MTKETMIGIDLAKNVFQVPRVIIPFLTGLKTGLQAAVFNFIAGVMPPMAMLGRSLLYVHSQRVAWSCVSSIVSNMYCPSHSWRTVLW